MFHRPTEAEILAQAQRALRERIARDGRRDHVPGLTAMIPHDEERSRRSLQSCHRYALYDQPRHAPPKDTGAYVPELAARLEDDRNLTDGARRCARKLAEYTYRRNREGRSAEITVTWLMKALGKCRRTVQRYLRQLEHGGYIATAVVQSGRTRMCAGLAIQLLAPLFPRHHAARWPGRPANPGVTPESQNKRFNRNSPRIPCDLWAVRCMEGVWRAFNTAWPPGTLPAH